MSKEELIEFLKENLSLEVTYTSGRSWSYPSLEIRIQLDGVEITSAETSIYPE